MQKVKIATWSADCAPTPTSQRPWLWGRMRWRCPIRPCRRSVVSGMWACSLNNSPVGVATKKPELRARLPVDDAAHRLHKFFAATAELMTVLARACGHTHLSEFGTDDLTTFDREMAHLTDVAYGGVSR